MNSTLILFNNSLGIANTRVVVPPSFAVNDQFKSKSAGVFNGDSSVNYDSILTEMERSAREHIKSATSKFDERSGRFVWPFNEPVESEPEPEQRRRRRKIPHCSTDQPQFCKQKGKFWERK